MQFFSIGVDFGKTGGRAALVDVKDGTIVAEAYHEYKYGVMLQNFIDGSVLPENYAVIHPDDYYDIMVSTVKEIMTDRDPESVIGIGVDLSSCTMLPVTKDGVPVCKLPGFETNPHAFAKVTRHLSATAQAERFCKVAFERKEKWLDYYSNQISPEWMFPKILETIEEAPEVYAAADYFMEATDWIAWKLSGNFAKSAVLAGFKSFYVDGEYPSADYFVQVDSRLENVLDKVDIPVCHSFKVGNLTKEAADSLGLTTKTAVSFGLVDLLTSVSGVQAAGTNTMTAMLGDYASIIVKSENKAFVEGVSGPIPATLSKSYYLYKAKQSCMGVNYAWYLHNHIPPEYHENARKEGRNLHSYIAQQMMKLKIGENGIISLNWLNGNASVLHNKNLTGLFVGMTLDTRIEHIYRALIEAMAFDTRVIKERLNEKGIYFDEFYGIGTIAERNPFIMQIYADVLNITVKVAGSPLTPVIGSAVFAAVAAGEANGGYNNLVTASRAMGKIREDKIYQPIPENVQAYNVLYKKYCEMHDYFGKQNPQFMADLIQISKNAKAMK